MSDRATGTPVERGHLFRVASISKPITAVAVMRLVEQGRLRLTDRVFGAGALLGTIYGSKPYGPDIEAITVRHLPEHTAGGWSNDENDPMFWHPEFNHAALIGWVLDDRPLAASARDESCLLQLRVLRCGAADRARDWGAVLESQGCFLATRSSTCWPDPSSYRWAPDTSGQG